MLEQNKPLEQEGENDTITVDKTFLKKKKGCTCYKFSWKYVTIILAICLAGSIASLLTVLLLPKRFFRPPDQFFRLIKDYYVSDIPPSASWNDYRVLKRDLLGKLNPRDDFWSDKIKTQDCVDGVEKGIQMVPILWSKRNWDIETQNELHLFLENDVDWQKNPQGLILKPAHLTNANNIIKIDKNFNWNEIKEKIDQIPMTAREVAVWQQDPKNYELAYATLTPGLILQKTFDIYGNPFREIKIAVVWGRVVAFVWSGHGIGLVAIGIDEADNSRFCLVSDCEKLEKIMNWDLVIPKIEKFASKLHLDFVRIDIFPIDHTVKFYVNEIELDSGGGAKKVHEFVVEKLKYLNQIFKNSKDPETFFLDRKLHDLRCNIFDSPYFWKST